MYIPYTRGLKPAYTNVSPTSQLNSKSGRTGGQFLKKEI